MMKFILRLHAEITIKSKSVRKRHGKVLVNSLRILLQDIARDFATEVRVHWRWDRIEVILPRAAADAIRSAVIAELEHVPGIAWFSEVIEFPLPAASGADQQSSFAPILSAVLDQWRHQLVGNSFAVRVKRKGSHEFGSKDLERFIGAGVLAAVPNARVQLKQPTQELRIEIDQDIVRLLGRKIAGLGGFPIPTQETVVSLLSGGYDSSVASFHLLRRGARTHFCFFNLGGDLHETGVQQTAYHLWNRYSRSHPLKFISIDFAPVVEEILSHVDNGLMGVVLKRQMLRAASHVADYIGAAAIVTGEAMGQVSSQTLSNLKVIEQAAETLVLRPLISTDKQTIIDTARAIGTEDFAKSMPEYCGVISNKPTVKANLSAVLAAEAQLDPQVLERAVRTSRMMDCRELAQRQAPPVTTIPPPAEDADEPVVIDIRAQDEVEHKPLVELVPEVSRVEVLHIPFFKLSSKFSELAADKTYLLFCERGVMSKLQALYLRQQGHQNVAVYARSAR